MKLGGLNSIRFIGFFILFILHFYGLHKLGSEVVSLFFTLSSFLLTYLLMNELEETGMFSIKNFFIRRSLRIFPLYFSILFFAFVILPNLAESVNYSIKLPEKPWYYWLFIGNYENSDHLYALKFLWTISVEEQFYLIFMLLSPLFKRYFFVAIGLLSTCYLGFISITYFYHFQEFGIVFTYFPFFIFGMLGAYFYKKKTIQIRTVVVTMMSGAILCYFFQDFQHA